MLCIGLFGTCGGSTWRNEFIKKYSELDVSFFNPQVDDWKPELAEIEADHLVNDDIILFPVTNETFGTGSLAETGFSIMQAINSNDNRSVVIMVEKDVKEELKVADPVASKESTRARALVRAHLTRVKKPNVYIVDSLDEMLEVSLKLYQVHTILSTLRK
jgi:hypothetical protein